jgi:hypothetical protein
MFGHLREAHFQQGCRDRDAGYLPRRRDSAYLDGYLSDRPAGLDEVIQYFPTLSDFVKWKIKHQVS